MIFRSAAAAEEASSSDPQLLEQIEQRDRQLESLERQVDELNRRLAAKRATTPTCAPSLRPCARCSCKSRPIAARISKHWTRSWRPPRPLSRFRTTPVISFEQPEQVTYRSSEFGRFYALLIGVQMYDLLDDLASPANDVGRIGQILADRYGFSVISLADPDQLTVMRAINQLNETLGENDNLLDLFLRSRQPPSQQRPAGRLLAADERGTRRRTTPSGFRTTS